MPIAFQTRLPAGATFGTTTEYVAALEAMSFTDVFTASDADADGTLIGSLASLGGTEGDGEFTASGGDRPTKQTRDGRAVLRFSGTNVMAFAGTLPTTGFTLACRIHVTRDTETKARFVCGNNAAGDDGKSIVAQTTILTSDSEVDTDRQYFRMYRNATPDVLDSEDAIVRGDQWFSVVITRSTSRDTITVEGGGLPPVTRLVTGSLTTAFASLFLGARSSSPGTSGFIGDVRHLFIAAGDKAADADELAAILGILKVA